MPSSTVVNWLASVKANGGKLALPYVGPMQGAGPPAVPSAVYPHEVWVPKVNLGVKNGGWPLPNEYSQNGRLGYYHAPAAIQAELKNTHIATSQESKNAGKQLMEQWGVPTMFRGLQQYFGSLALIGLVLVGVYVVVKRQ